MSDSKPMAGWLKLGLIVSGVLVAITGLKRLKETGFIRDEQPTPEPEEKKPS